METRKISIENFLNITLDVNEWSHMNKGRINKLCSLFLFVIYDDVTLVLPPGALIVVVDMSLAMISVLTNLMVITSIRRKEEMMAVTFNMVSYKCHHTIQRKKTQYL